MQIADFKLQNVAGRFVVFVSSWLHCPSAPLGVLGDLGGSTSASGLRVAGYELRRVLQWSSGLVTKRGEVCSWQGEAGRESA